MCEKSSNGIALVENDFIGVGICVCGNDDGWTKPDNVRLWNVLLDATRRRPALIVEQHKWKITHIIIAAVLVDAISSFVAR